MFTFSPLAHSRTDPSPPAHSHTYPSPLAHSRTYPSPPAQCKRLLYHVMCHKGMASPHCYIHISLGMATPYTARG